MACLDPVYPGLSVTHHHISPDHSIEYLLDYHLSALMSGFHVLILIPEINRKIHFNFEIMLLV